MGHAVAISRLDLSASNLRDASGRAGSVRAGRRLLALALVLDGVDRTTAALQCGMDRQTLRDWVHRSHAERLTSLDDLKAPGAALTSTEAQKTSLAALVEQGPDLETDGVVCWRRIDLRDKIKSLFGVEMHERSVGKDLTSLGTRRLKVRPQHPNSDPEAQEAFAKTLTP